MCAACCTASRCGIYAVDSTCAGRLARSTSMIWAAESTSSATKFCAAGAEPSGAKWMWIRPVTCAQQATHAMTGVLQTNKQTNNAHTLTDLALFEPHTVDALRATICSGG